MSDDIVRKLVTRRTNMKYYKEPSNSEKLCIHHLVSIMPNKPKTPQEFIEFCKQMMHTKTCEEAALATSEQSDCSLWYELRYARITALKAYKAAHCKVLNGALTEAIMGVSKLKDTDAMKRGRLLECEVKSGVEKIKNIKTNKCGIILDPLHPFIGDGYLTEKLLIIALKLNALHQRNL